MGELKDKAKGTFDETKGKITGDKSDEMKGKAEKAWGYVQGKANDVRDDVSSRTDTTEVETRRSSGGETMSDEEPGVTSGSDTLSNRS